MRLPVEAPALRPATHNLVASVSPQTDGRWDDGVSFNPRGCQKVYGYAPACPSENKSAYQECSLIHFDPWLLEVGLSWATGDLGANPKQRAAEALEVGTSSALEYLTAAGTGVTGGVSGSVMAGGVEPLNFADVGTTGATVADARTAFGLVEAHLLSAADHIGGAGTIFVSPADAVALTALVVERDGKLYSVNTGALLIVGNVPAGKIWGVSGDVDLYLSDIEVYEAFDRAKNDYVVRAERFGLVTWNCTPYGVGVTP